MPNKGGYRLRFEFLILSSFRFVLPTYRRYGCIEYRILKAISKNQVRSLKFDSVDCDDD